jgi:YidC/Oxa1 family membrane protein insertase
MEKRLFAAVILSIVILVVWGAILPKIFPEAARAREQAELRESGRVDTSELPGSPAAPVSPDGDPFASIDRPAPAVAAPEAAPDAAPPQSAIGGEMLEFVDINRRDYVARFSSRGAQLVSFTLKEHRRRDGAPVDLVTSRPAGSSDFPFAIQSGSQEFNRAANESLYAVERSTKGDEEIVTFRWADGAGNAVVKSFAFGRDFPFDFRVDARGPEAFRVVIGPGIRDLEPHEADNRFLGFGNAVVQIQDDFDVINREKAASFSELGRVDFVGVQDNYFLAALIPTRSGSAVIRRIDVEREEGRKSEPEIFAGLNAVDGIVAGRAFFGPKQADLLETYGLERALNFGIFGFIARGLLYALLWIYSWVGNYGWAIVVLTAFIKVVLYPLQHKSIVSMKKMQKVQPKVNALREKYKKSKTDPAQRQKLNTEMMQLYSAEGINPMSGCFPILLQLPILWAFYTLLSTAIEMRGADFMLWINDLSAKDPYYVTPLLMTITMFIQQWITPTTADPMQRRIFLIMPLIFGWIFKEFPSGLVLYWLVQNVLTIAQQAIMNHYWKEHPESLET